MNPLAIIHRAAQLYGARDFLGARDAIAPLLAQKRPIPDALHLGGLISSELGNVAEGIARLEQAVQLGGRAPSLFANLVICLSKAGQVTKAKTYLERVFSMAPGLPHAHLAASDFYFALGDADRSLEHLRIALSSGEDDPRAFSNYLYLHNFSSRRQSEIAKEHAKFGERFESGIAQRTFHNDRDPNRKLRIGYLSADFQYRSVAHFAWPLFAEHDADAFEIVAFYGAQREDRVTEQFRSKAAGWVNVSTLSPGETADVVQANAIDILVDLGGHTGESMLMALVHRGAPIQVSAIGYPNTTGLRACDYRLTDRHVDPETTPASHHTEKLVRIAGGFLCYSPLGEIEPLAEEHKRDTFVFGSFNTMLKTSERTYQLWSRILKECEGAKLMMKSVSLSDDLVRATVLDRFQQHGVAQDRLVLIGRTPDTSQHRAMYAEMDLALDPFPYNGTTTTCEALYMGLPVVSLWGDRHVSRVSASLVDGIGLGSFVARSENDYVNIAVRAYRERHRIPSRAAVRDMFLSSPLCDKVRYAREVEAAYREMWKTWVGDVA